MTIGSDFHRTLKFTNRYGTLEFSGAKAFKNPHMYNNSTKRAVSSWMRHNSAENPENAARGMKPT